VDVAARIREIQAAAARKNEVTVATLVEELEVARVAAHDDKQFAAATSAIVAKAKICGLMRDKIEVGGVGEFDKCETEADVIDALLADGDPRDALVLLDRMRDLVLERISDHARPVTTARQPKVVASGEAGRALAVLRPIPKHKR